MSTAQTSTAADVARLLCRGYNEWIKEHGPDTDGAKAEGQTLTVVHGGEIYRLEVTPGLMLRLPGESGRVEMHRTCGLLNCTDPEHLVLRKAGEGQES